MEYRTGHLSMEDTSKITGVGIAVVMMALGAALIPMAYVGFLGLPFSVIGAAMLMLCAAGIKEGQLELAPQAGGLALIVLGSLLLAAAAWLIVVEIGPARSANAESLGVCDVFREMLHALISPAIVVAGMRLRFEWSNRACAALYGTMLATVPLALGISAVFVNLWSTAD